MALVHRAAAGSGRALRPGMPGGALLRSRSAHAFHSRSAGRPRRHLRHDADPVYRDRTATGLPLASRTGAQRFFVRWEEPGGERFNIEATTLGFTPRDDEHFRRWPKPIRDEEVRLGLFLRNLSPREEVAAFFRERGQCWLGHLRPAPALEAFAEAARLAPRLLGVQCSWAVASILQPRGQPSSLSKRLQGRHGSAGGPASTARARGGTRPPPRGATDSSETAPAGRPRRGSAWASDENVRRRGA